MRDSPTHVIGSAQQLRRQLQITPAQRLPDPSAANPFALDHVTVTVNHVETVLPACSSQHGEIAGAAVTEPKIIANDQIANAQPGDQQVFDKRLCRHRCQPLIEFQAQHSFDTQSVQRQ